MHKTGATWTAIPIYVFLPNGPGNVPNGSDGINPQGPLVADEAGNLYGTTATGGSAKVGIAYMLSRTASGWKETVLYNFGSGEPKTQQADFPTGGLVLVNGVLYGLTTSGFLNGGTLYSLTPPAAGQTSWTFKIIYAFNDYQPGLAPLGSLVTDNHGDLYVATSAGGDPTLGFNGAIDKFSIATFPR